MMLSKLFAYGFCLFALGICGCGGSELGEATDEEAKASMEAAMDMDAVKTD